MSQSFSTRAGTLSDAKSTRWRSLLFVPAVRKDLIAKVGRYPADAIVVDLEDSTPIGEKAAGRLNAVELVPSLAEQGVCAFVRVNAPGSGWFKDDIRYGVAEGARGIVVPMAELPASLDHCAKSLAATGQGHLGIIVGLETARGIANAEALLSHSQVIAGYFGAEDYVADLGGVRTESNQEVHYARSHVALAGRLARKPVLDQVVTNFSDDDRFSKEATQARAMGFAGKLCIHPSQVALANAGFTPSEAEVARAERLLAAYDIAVASGVAAIDFEGQMVDEPLAAQARHLLLAAGVFIPVEAD